MTKVVYLHSLPVLHIIGTWNGLYGVGSLTKFKDLTSVVSCIVLASSFFKAKELFQQKQVRFWSLRGRQMVVLVLYNISLTKHKAKNNSDVSSSI